MFGYFGAKHANAHKYQAPKHDLIVEPFAGAAGYSCYWLERDPTKRALLIEKDPRIVDAWQRILTSTPETIMAWPLPITGSQSSDTIVLALGGDNIPLPGHTRKVSSRSVKDFASVRYRIARMRASIGDSIRVQLGDYTDAVNVESSWFVDPPYQHQGHRYLYGSATIDYTALGQWVAARKGQTLVCEAAPADWLPFKPVYALNSLANTLGTELVWESDPDPTLFD